MGIYVGRWDCLACGNIGNLGPNLHCEKCGSPRPENVKFYMASEEEVKDAKKIAQAKAGADWVCAFCNGQNHATSSNCNSCGASKIDSEKKLKTRLYNNDNIPKSSKQNEFSNIKNSSKQQQDLAKGKAKISKKVIIGCLYLPASIIGLFALYFALAHIFTTPINVEVVGSQWERNIEVERYLLLTENDWSVPSGGKLISQHQAIHHYVKVQTGTVTKTRNVQVKVGTETYVCGKRDLGNGYFEDEYCTRDVYENRTETYEEPVYREDPIYRTEYTYTIWRWKKTEPLKERGENFKAKWPIVSGNKIRPTDSIEKYSITIITDKGKKYEEKLKYKKWKNIKLHNKLKAKKSTIFGFYLKLEKDNL